MRPTVFVLIILLTALFSGCGGGSDAKTPVTKTQPKKFTVTATSGEGGGVSPESISVEENKTTAFTLTADENYVVDTVTGCNGSLTGNDYTTGAITAACEVTASFKLTNYLVTATAVQGGSITPSEQTITYGEIASFNLTPDENYVVDTVTGCNGSLTGNDYTTGAISAACEVTASFKLTNYLVTATAEQGGSITPSEQTITYGEIASFNLTPDENYVVDTVSGCNGSLNGNDYTTGAITAACEVTASFKLTSYEVTGIAGKGGVITPSNQLIEYNQNATFIVTPDQGYQIKSITGCDGALDGYNYVTSEITFSCQVDVLFNSLPVITITNNEEIDEQTEITLTASVDDTDGSITKYEWTQLSGDVFVPFQGETSNELTFTSPKSETGNLTLEFKLTVTDNDNGISNENVVVQVIDLPTPEDEIDTDGDGVADIDDLFPNDFLEYADSDLDGIGDNSDNCPFTANALQVDSNANGMGDLCEQKKILISGTFLDSPTAGLFYTNNNGIYGTTNKNGNYQCYSGDVITFSVGENGPSLGQAQCNEVISPFELLETDESFENYTRASSIARLLQSLDEDNNPSNGIVITPETIEKIANDSFTLNNKDQFDEELINWFDANPDVDLRIVTLADAISHVRDTLENNPLFINQVCDYYDKSSETALKKYNPAPNCNHYKMKYLFEAYIKPQHTKEIQLVETLQEKIVEDVLTVKENTITLTTMGERINTTISNIAAFDKVTESSRQMALKIALKSTIILNQFVETIMPVIMEQADLTDSDAKQIEQYRQLTTKVLSYILQTEICYQDGRENGGVFSLKCTKALTTYVLGLKKLIAVYDIDDNDKIIYDRFLDNIVVTLKIGKNIYIIAKVFLEYDKLIEGLPEGDFRDLKNIAKGKDLLKVAVASKELIDLALLPKNNDETVSNDIRNGISDTLGNLLNTAGCWLPAKDGYSFDSKSKACISAVTGIVKQAVNGIYAVNATFRLDNVSELRNTANISYEALHTYVNYGGNLDLMQKAGYPLNSLTIADEILYLEEVASRLTLENGWVFTNYHKSQLIDDFDNKLSQLITLNSRYTQEINFDSVLVVDAPSKMFVNQLYRVDLKANIYVPFFNDVLEKDATGIRMFCSAENSNYPIAATYEYIHQENSRETINASFELEMLKTGVNNLRCEVRSSSNEGNRILGKRNITIAVVEPNDTTDLDENALKVVKGVSFSDLNLAKCVQEHVNTFSIENLAELETLSCNDQQIINTQGLEFLTGLHSLELSKNLLTKIDLSTLTKLKQLTLNENSLTEINVTYNVQLEELDLSFNQLEGVDLQSNVSLAIVNLGNNKLQALDISKNENITSLYASSNQLAEIDLTNNTVLVELDFMFNKFKSINLKNNALLQMLFLSNNNLNELDLSNNTKLTNLLISSNNLTTIAIPQTAPLEHLRIDDNPLTQATIDYLLTLPGYNFSWGLPEHGTPEVVSIAPLVAYVNTPTQFTISGINFPDTMDAKIEGANCYEKQLLSPTSYIMMCQSYIEGDTALTVYEVGDLAMENGRFVINIQQDTEVIDPTKISTTFPDNNLASCVQDYVNANSITNLKNINELICKYKDITDSSGIEILTKLETLDFYGNELTSIDVSQNTLLTSLTLASNQLTEIDVSNNTALTLLELKFNKEIISLDVSKNTQLITLSLAVNKLTNIDVSRNTELINLNVAYNLLTSIDVTKNTNLQTLQLSYDNQITSIDVSNNTELKVLTLHNNKLSSINISNLTLLEELHLAGNQLTSLNVNNNPNLEILRAWSNSITAIDISNNPELTSLSMADNKLTSVNFSTNPLLSYVSLTTNSFTQETIDYLNTINWIETLLFDQTPVPPTTQTGKLNDTGITTCSDNRTSGLNCPVTGFEGQDADHGRDALATKNELTKIGGGNAGFDFTKLDANGNALSASATNWSCVQDNVTGLVWEVKTVDGGLQDQSHTYTWYNSTGGNDGGSAGTFNGGFCFDDTNCDTEKYAAQVNSQGLCGASDWRLPDKREIQSIVDYSTYSPAIDTTYFINTLESTYWSASPGAGSVHFVWFVSFSYGLDFSDNFKSKLRHVRLVRGSQ